MTKRKARTRQAQRAHAEAAAPAGRRAPPAQSVPSRKVRPRPAASDPSAFARRAIPPLLIVIAGTLAYANSFSGAFLYDDFPRIVNNAQVRQLFPLFDVMGHTTRPLIELSLAINFALGGLDVWGYHAFNLAVHLLAALTLFGVVRRMFESSRLREHYGVAAPWLALAVALLWLLHPLQTESVTYVIQRAESLMSLFFLATLYCGIRAASSPNPRRWHAAAIAACAFGMGTKEVMVAAPLVMLVYDRMFIASSWREILRARLGLYAGLAATWIILPFVVATSRPEDTVGVNRTLQAAWTYSLTQFGVIVHYLRLALWPSPLVLDYAWPLADGVKDVAPYAAIVVALLAATIWGLVRGWWLAFWGAWFFLILAPTSTILPIADAAVEHRMYLPLAAIVVLCVVGVYELSRVSLARIGATEAITIRICAAVFALVAAGLGFATVARNEDYRSELAMWGDIVAKRPANARAQFSYGVSLTKQGRVGESIGPLTEAVRLRPEAADAHAELGASLYREGRRQEGLAQLFEAVRLDPRDSSAQNNLANALFTEGRIDDAVTHYFAAVRANPGAADAHYNLALALVRQGDTGQAIVELQETLRIRPNYPNARNNLRALQARAEQAKAAR